METQKHERKEVKPMPKENSDFADSEANFLRILDDCSSTARAVCFLDLFVHLCHDRSNSKRPMCYFAGV